MIYESTRKMSVKEQEAYDLGYLNGKEAALRGPDPDTGLLPCGCGGVAEELFDGFSFDGDGMECNDYLVKCKKCGMQTQVIQTWNEKARDIWNTAMGWKGGAE